MSLQVEVAKTAGFCFGVDRAVSAVYRLLEEGKRAATLGPIIHNPQVTGDLEAKGSGPCPPPRRRPPAACWSSAPTGCPRPPWTGYGNWACPLRTPPAPL